MAGNVEQIRGPSSAGSIIEGLEKMTLMLRQTLPRAVQVCFDFDGKLHVHIDVRKAEDVTLVQSVLPTLGAGQFHTLSLRPTPNRPFLHRISAIVDG